MLALFMIRSVQPLRVLVYTEAIVNKVALTIAQHQCFGVILGVFGIQIRCTKTYSFMNYESLLWAMQSTSVALLLFLMVTR